MKKLFAIISLVVFSVATSYAYREDDDAYAKVVYEFLDATNFNQTIEQIGETYRKTFESIPLVDTSKFPLFFNRLAEKMPALCVEIYPKYYTIDDLKQRMAYFKTPLGKKESETVPKIYADIAEMTRNLLLDPDGFDAAGKVNPAFVAALDEYLDAVDYDNLTLQQIKSGGDLPDDILAVLVPRLREVAYRSYSKYFTTEEIKQLTVAAKDPISQKFVKNTPLLQQDLQMALLPSVMGIMEEVWPEMGF